MQKEFSNKSSLKKWLISSVGVVLTSVTLLGSAQKIEYQFDNPKVMSSVMDVSSNYFPDGRYLVTYKNTDNIDEDNINFSKMVMVISLEAREKRSITTFGGLSSLLRSLEKFEYYNVIDKTNTENITAHLWVIEPNNPEEIQELKQILQDKSICYAFNDHSGYISPNNFRTGNGMQVRGELQQVVQNG